MNQKKTQLFLHPLHTVPEPFLFSSVSVVQLGPMPVGFCIHSATPIQHRSSFCRNVPYCISIYKSSAFNIPSVPHYAKCNCQGQFLYCADHLFGSGNRDQTFPPSLPPSLSPLLHKRSTLLELRRSSHLYPNLRNIDFQALICLTGKSAFCFAL